MVLGSGMIATALKTVDRTGVVYAASGLSNLKGADPIERLREASFLKEQMGRYTNELFVYISSYSIDDQVPDNNTPYLEHKLQMENLVKALSSRYLIIRTSNVVGESRQPGNLMNFIFQNLQMKTPFEVWTNTTRNLIDVTDLALMAGAAIDLGYCNETLYLTHPADIPIYHIVRHFEALSGIKGNYTLADKGVYYGADKNLARQLFGSLKLEADPDLYAKNLIERYFRKKF